MKSNRNASLEIRRVNKKYSQKELKHLVQLAKEAGGKKFSSAEAFLKHIQKLPKK